MKKIIFLSIFLFSVFAIFVYLFFYSSILENQNIQETQINGENSLHQEDSQDINIDSKDIVRNKIETIRKRLALKGLIIQGDAYYSGGDILLALQKYLEFYRQNPEDELIIEKLGDAYSELGKHTSAYNYYSKIPSPGDDIQEKLVLSLSYSTDFSDINQIEKLQQDIQNLNLDDQKKYFYMTSFSCPLGFHECKKDFGEYFWPSQEQEEPVILYKELLNTKGAISNYQNFRVDDVYLKDAFIIASWYSDGLYTLSAHMGEKLLEEKVGYKPILKIVAQSYYELGELKKARSILSKYYEIDSKDIAVNYLLGIINTKLREYVLANIYFNKAISLGYENPVEIKRQLIHNFYLLENDENILKQFVSLIEDFEDFESSDLSLGIYYHIIHQDYETALDWAKRGQELFSENPGNFYAYQAWILREQGELENSNSVLSTGIELEPENPFLLINLGYNALEEEKIGLALIHFKKVASLVPESEFTIQAQQEIEKLQKK